MRQSHIAIIGAPLDLGQGRRGVDMGPSAMRVANLNARVASLGYTVEDLGNVPVEQAEALPEGDASRQRSDAATEPVLDVGRAISKAAQLCSSLFPHVQPCSLRERCISGSSELLEAQQQNPVKHVSRSEAVGQAFAKSLPPEVE